MCASIYLSQDLIAKNRTDVESWYEYGAFCMRVGDTSKAEESFRELVSIDQHHEKALIVLGVLSMLSERFADVCISTTSLSCA